MTKKEGKMDTYTILGNSLANFISSQKQQRDIPLAKKVNVDELLIEGIDFNYLPSLTEFMKAIAKNAWANSEVVVCLTSAKELEIQMAIKDFYSQFEGMQEVEKALTAFEERYYFELTKIIAKGVGYVELRCALFSFFEDVERKMTDRIGENRYATLQKKLSDCVREAIRIGESDVYIRKIK